METAGNKEFEEDTEKKGLGTPATRAGIIEKLIHSQYAIRKGKQILPTDDGKVLIEILPDFLKSASMTAEWENQLLLMEHGEIAPEQFMSGITKMLTMMLNRCDEISDDETRRFQTKESIGTCPVCGSCGNCHVHAYYDRSVIDFRNGRKVTDSLCVLRLICDSCHHTHALLPDILIPYASYSLMFILRVLGECFLGRSTMEHLCDRFSITPVQLHKWLKFWNKHKQQ